MARQSRASLRPQGPRLWMERGSLGGAGLLLGCPQSGFQPLEIAL